MHNRPGWRPKSQYRLSYVSGVFSSTDASFFLFQVSFVEKAELPYRLYRSLPTALKICNLTFFDLAFVYKV